MVMQITGEPRQLSPDEEQAVGAEVQQAIVPDTVLPRIEEPEKREIPPPVPERAPMPSGEALAAAQAAQIIFGVPILRLNRYSGSDTEWQPLVRWDITDGRTGDLHSISLLSDNDAKTRYRVIIGNVDQLVPTDRQTSTPLDLPWRSTVIPGGSSVYVEVRSTDGTAINVDGMITGTER